ncbi:Hypothetical_protein [Hexamita inflata]|uniref:Hypothetical_protein n=1 Tax=Hexamita inflata TaxID=28002 RepID=A0AA86NA63_9EUKA|nr:Hypothetical protein HINF_LOCUS3579 [Hexamita inflata]
MFKFINYQPKTNSTLLMQKQKVVHCKRKQQVEELPKYITLADLQSDISKRVTVVGYLQLKIQQIMRFYNSPGYMTSSLIVQQCSSNNISASLDILQNLYVNNVLYETNVDFIFSLQNNLYLIKQRDFRSIPVPNELPRSFPLPSRIRFVFAENNKATLFLNSGQIFTFTENFLRELVSIQIAPMFANKKGIINQQLELVTFQDKSGFVDINAFKDFVGYKQLSCIVENKSSPKIKELQTEMEFENKYKTKVNQMLLECYKGNKSIFTLADELKSEGLIYNSLVIAYFVADTFGIDLIGTQCDKSTKNALYKISGIFL